jgi:hypothetical protein
MLSNYYFQIYNKELIHLQVTKKVKGYVLIFIPLLLTIIMTSFFAYDFSHSIFQCRKIIQLVEIIWVVLHLKYFENKPTPFSTMKVHLIKGTHFAALLWLFSTAASLDIGRTLLVYWRSVAALQPDGPY